MLKVKEYTVNHFLENCYLLYDEVSRQCAIVDPGMTATYEDAQLTQFIEQHQLTPTMILLTHAHVDHIAGLRQTYNSYHLPVTLHADGVKLLKEAKIYGSVMGFDNLQPLNDLPCNLIEDNTMLTLGDSKIEARYVPGHCEGSMCYVLPLEKMVLTGDALFRMSIGRTDMPGGNYDLLLEKLHSRILTLPDDYEVLPGHGDISSIGEERRGNPFL
jgi:hydroxyacylglutathione hydrolase